jgi:hypothetical protein
MKDVSRDCGTVRDGASMARFDVKVSLCTWITVEVPHEDLPVADDDWPDQLPEILADYARHTLAEVHGLDSLLDFEVLDEDVTDFRKDEVSATPLPSKEVSSRGGGSTGGGRW